MSNNMSLIDLTEPNKPRARRSGARLYLTMMALSCCWLAATPSVMAQTATPGKQKAEPKIPSPAKSPQDQGAKKNNAATVPLKPVDGLFGTSRNKPVGPLAIPVGPKLTAEDWEKKGREALAARKFDDAISAFKEVVQMKSALPGGWYGLGLAQEAKRMWPEAANAFRMLANLTPTSGQSYALLANALVQANQNEAALRVLDRAIELNPNSPELIIQQGNLFLQQKDTRRAEQAFLQALGSAPDSPAAHTGMGDVFAQSNHQSAALDEYDAALRLDAAYLPARLGRATALAATGRLRQAEDLLAAMSSELEIAASTLR